MERVLAFVIFFGVGGLFALIGLLYLYSMVGFLRRSVRASATVVGPVGPPSSNSKTRAERRTALRSPAGPA